MQQLLAIIKWGLDAVRPWWPVVRAGNGLRLGVLVLVVGVICALLFFVCDELIIARLPPPVRASGPCLHAAVEICPAITIRDTSLSEISAVFGIPEKSLRYLNARPFRDIMPAGSIVVLPLPNGWTP